MKTKARSVDYWRNQIIGQKSDLPLNLEEQSNFELADYLLRRDREKEKNAA